MTVSTRTLAPAATPAAGVGARAEHTPSHTAASRELLARAGAPGYRHWLAHVMPAAACSHPIRLRVRADWHDSSGRLALREHPSDDMPDGALYVACKNRRRTVCPACAETYRADTYQLIKAGLHGGKGVPASVDQHPCVFVTFSAPSFGPVHTASKPGHTRPCTPRRAPQTCPHRATLACWQTHSAENPQAGTPLCAECYDYPGQAVWNLHAGELWRRTTIALSRALAPLARSLGVRVRVSYAKVAEYQHRGAVHFHALIRLDDYNQADPDAITPPHPGITAEHLASCVQDSTRATVFTTEPHPANRTGWTIGWGEQLDIRPVRLAPGQLDDHGHITTTAVAGYLAKYATKATEDTGLVSRRITADDITIREDLHGPTHQTRQLRACWHLGTRPLACRTPAQRHAWRDGWGKLHRWAHMLGYGGHFSTKSRRYSTTLSALRAVRRAYQRREPADPPRPTEHGINHHDQAGEDADIVITYTFDGVGWLTTADAQLANTAAAKAREYRRVAREETEQLIYQR